MRSYTAARPSPSAFLSARISAGSIAATAMARLLSSAAALPTLATRPAQQLAYRRSGDTEDRRNLICVQTDSLADSSARAHLLVLPLGKPDQEQPQRQHSAPIR